MSFRGERFGLHRFYRHAFFGSAVGGAVLAGAWISMATAGEWDVIPSLEIVETYTDNVDLVSEQEAKTDDFITRLSPSLSVAGQGARASLNLVYTPSLLIFAESDEGTDLRHFLSAQGSAELSEDLLFVDGGASINQQYLDRGGAISSNEDNVTDNRRTIQNYTISPYLRRNIGTYAIGELRYRASYTDSSQPGGLVDLNDILSNTLTHSVSARVDSGVRFTRFTWSAELNYVKNDRQSGNRDSDSQTARLFGTYIVNRWLRLVSSVGYENIDDASLTRRPDGVIWDAGATLTPGPRTELTVRAGRRYGEGNWNGDFVYRISDRTRINAGYSEEITNTQNVLVNELISNPDGIAVDPGGFSLLDSAFKRTRAFGGLSGERGHNSFSAQGFWEKRVPESGTRTEKNYGGNANITHRFSRYFSGTLGGSYQNTKFLDLASRTDDFYSGTANLNYQISQSISGGLTYIFTYRDSTDADRELQENAVKVNVRATF